MIICHFVVYLTTTKTIFYKKDPVTKKSVILGGPVESFPNDFFGEEDATRSDDYSKVTILELIAYFNSVHSDPSRHIKMDDIQVNLSIDDIPGKSFLYFKTCLFLYTTNFGYFLQ